jgi:hypothetical protein
MKIEQVKEIANAVLYEGYLLYPYRHSAIKNRRRWTFGVVYPQEYSQASGEIEPWVMHTECLITGSPHTTLDVYVRFLHLLVRTIQQPEMPDTSSQVQEETGEWSIAARLANEPWEEGIEREVSALNLSLGDLVAQPRLVQIDIPGGRMVDDASGDGVATTVREQQPLVGIVRIDAESVGENLYRLCIQVENRTPSTGSLSNQYAVLRHSFVSTHTILQVRQGSFISLMDPPEALRALAQACQNRHTWPVLVGNAGELDTMLSSPIILYDYPQIAPESPGPLFDGTEIDEILTLRIMTLSDEEKEEIRRGDERARAILERTEALTPEQFMQLHGTIRSLHPAEPVGRQFSAPDTHYPGVAQAEDYPPPGSILIDGKEVKAGSRVRLRPQVRADAFDMLLAGKTAQVEAIQQDFENRLYLVVTVDDDPGKEQWDERVLPGHRFYFFPEEVELLDEKEEASWRKP